MKKTLSGSSGFLAALPAGAALLFFVLTLKDLWEGEYHFELPALGGFLLLLAYLFHSLKELSYDEDYLYIKDGKKEVKVELKHVRVIKTTMTNISEVTVWKLRYKDSEGKLTSVRFLPLGYRKSVFELSENVKAHNKDLVFTTWTSTFDFDQ